MPKITVNQFNGGISDDIRKSSGTEFAVSKHFDVFSNPKRLVPYRSLEVDTNDGSTPTGMKQYVVKDYVYASASAKLYGLGQTGGGLTKVVFKADAISGNWTLPASSEGNGAVKNDCFFEFQDYLWGFQGTNQVFKWGLLSGTPSITNSVTTVASSITSVANGIIASDANAYMAYNNVVVRISPSGTVTDSAKIVPSNFKITSLANYGSYMAIACSPKDVYNGKSKVFIWNLSSDLFQDTVDWGEGELRVLENIEGFLIGVTDRYLNNSAGAGKGSLVIQSYSGGTPKVEKEIFTQALTGKSVPISKAVKNNRLFFAAKIMTNTAGTEYNEGLWSFGRKNANYPWAVTLDIIDENITTSGIQAFGTASNYFFITHSGDGSIDKTNDASVYTFTSVYESLVFDFGSPYITKGLRSVSVSAAPKPTGGVVTAKYRVDSETSWTTIGSFTVSATVMQRSFLNIESTGADFSSFRELEIRVESTGGAEITGFEPDGEPLNEAQD